MRPQEFETFLKEKPFRPIRVTLTDGRTYDIMHPDQGVVGRGVVVIGVPGKNPTYPLFDFPTTISLLHIMQIEYLEMLKPPHGTATNGTE